MSVFLNNLDDYIVPSQACVNPFVISKNNEDKESKSKISKKIILSTDSSVSEFTTTTEIKPNLIKTKISSSSAKVAAVSLNDCLACR